MTALVEDAIARLVVRGTAQAGRDARTLPARLAGMALAAPQMPDRAILLVRQVDAVARRGWGEDDVEAQVRAAVADAWRIAARPWLGAPADAPAVRFADEAELLACYARDVALSVEDRWWWLQMAPRLAPDVATILAADPRLLPAVLALLGQVGADRVVVGCLTPAQATDLARTVATTFGAAFAHARQAAAGSADSIPDTSQPRPRVPAAAAGDRGAWLLQLCRVAATTPHRLPAVVAAAASTSPPPVTLHPDPRPGAKVQGKDATHADAPGPRPEGHAEPQPAPEADSSTSPRVTLAAPPQLDETPPGPWPAGQPSPTPADPTAGSSDGGADAVGIAVNADPPPPAPKQPGTPDDPDDQAPGPEEHEDLTDGVASSLAGILHLVGALADLDAKIERSWEAVIAGARWILSDPTPDDMDDPVWRVLAALSVGDGLDADLDASREPVSEVAARVGPALAAHLQDRLAPWTELPIHTLLRRPGVITTTSSHVDVTFAIDDTWLPARLAGLDSDPGWVPWLGRVVLFHYR